MRLPRHWSLLYLVEKCISKGFFFSWAHNFKASSQYPCGHSLARAGDSWNQGNYNSFQILFHFMLLLLPSPRACSVPLVQQSSFLLDVYTFMLGDIHCLKLRDGETTPRWNTSTMEQNWRVQRSPVWRRPSPDIRAAIILYRRPPTKVPTQLTLHSQRS